MDREWLVVPQGVSAGKCNDEYTKLLMMMDQLETERGYRFTDEQAEVIQKLVTNLIDNIRYFKNRGRR